MKITTIADVPDELGNAWLQHLRDFDAAHPGCHFQIVADAPAVSLKDMVEMLRVDPPLEDLEVISDRVLKTLKDNEQEG